MIMNTPSWIEKLQNRWQVKSASQVLLILLVFICTGTTVMLLKPFIQEWLFSESHHTLYSILYWIFILPVYNLLLLFYGFIFGQFRFFWNFEKKFFRRIFSR
ncbi:MAG: DUF6787 family protein [Saprospiraceae bacterium]